MGQISFLLLTSLTIFLGSVPIFSSGIQGFEDEYNARMSGLKPPAVLAPTNSAFMPKPSRAWGGKSSATLEISQTFEDLLPPLEQLFIGQLISLKIPCKIRHN